MKDAHDISASWVKVDYQELKKVVTSAVCSESQEIRCILDDVGRWPEIRNRKLSSFDGYADRLNRASLRLQRALRLYKVVKQVEEDDMDREFRLVNVH